MPESEKAGAVAPALMYSSDALLLAARRLEGGAAGGAFHGCCRRPCRYTVVPPAVKVISAPVSLPSVIGTSLPPITAVPLTHLVALLQPQFAVRQLPGAGNPGRDHPVVRRAVLAAVEAVDRGVRPPVAHVEGIRRHAGAGPHLEDGRPQLRVQAGEEIERDDVGLREVGLEDVAVDEGRAVADLFLLGVGAARARPCPDCIRRRRPARRAWRRRSRCGRRRSRDRNGCRFGVTLARSSIFSTSACGVGTQITSLPGWPTCGSNGFLLGCARAMPKVTVAAATGNRQRPDDRLM